MTAAFLLLAAVSFLSGFGVACYRRGVLAGATSERSRVQSWGRAQHRNATR